jgi:L-malate glycosyltransferase
MNFMSKKIKLVHLLPNLSGGGAEKVCMQILLGIDKKKYQTYLLLFKDNDSSLGISEKNELKKNEVKIISLKKLYLLDIFNFFQIIKHLKKIQADILHCHLGGDIYGPLASYFLKKIKIISTEHNINISEKKINRFIKKFTIKRMNKICAVSLAVKNDAVKRYGINDQKISVVYNGVDFNYYQIEKNKDHNDSKIILGAMGRLNEQKGHKVLIEACSLLKNQNFILEIAGEGELKNDLEKQIKNLKLNNHLILLGQVDSRKWLNEIDIFIMPSLWEGLGLAVLEAAALKKPIIASAVDGILEILDENNSFLYKKNDPHQLAKIIDYLLENLDSQNVQEKINICYKITLNKFSLDKMIKNYQRIYENIASQ